MANSARPTVGRDSQGGSPEAKASVGPGLFPPDSGDAFMSRAQALTRRVEQAVLQRQFPPGHRLGTKSELQKELRVAAGTLNEALRVLQMQGLIEVRPGPGGGVFVAAATPSIKLRHGILRFRESGRSIEECIAVRNVLEQPIAVEAARSHEPDDLDDLYRLLDRMAENFEDPAQFMASNWALHRRLAESGNNTVLTSIYCTLMDFIEDSLEETLPDEVFDRETQTTLRIHSNLVEAVASGDAGRAAKAAADHTPNVTPLSDSTTGKSQQ